MKYQDLDLRKIREDNGLDFAHFTYLKKMCTCCFSPLDFPARYWHRGIKPNSMDNVQYLLFKNADNGSGVVKRNDELKEYQCVSWRFPMEKMKKISQDLQKQVGNEYVVLVPQNEYRTILIIKKSLREAIEKEIAQGFTLVTI